MDGEVADRSVSKSCTKFLVKGRIFAQPDAADCCNTMLGLDVLAATG